jgi:hypothetical protein
MRNTLNQGGKRYLLGPARSKTWEAGNPFSMKDWQIYLEQEQEGTPVKIPDGHYSTPDRVSVSW